MPSELLLHRSSRWLYLASYVEECIVRNNLQRLSKRHLAIRCYDALRIMDECLVEF